ncbi:calcium-binding protein [Azospirillum canadense]|uniref:calcium-binding protein n=1 Tax=Azospirillum canadense TaxID=403962 RepID=UPI00222666C9|nr:hypothetical protein [Azospirillum canadense]MCW2239320.1 Ca2+-binding RTX toxin-like protein [Azospirillum canadense]
MHKNSAIFGTIDNDFIWAKSGSDVVRAGSGNDIVFGRAGKDELFGEAGNDTLYGGNQVDHLEGGPGNDLLCGGNGDDLFFFYSGQDTFVGGSGHDYFMMNGSTTSGNSITVEDFKLGEDWLHNTDYFGLTSVSSINGGCDTQLVFSDILHEDNPGSPVSIVLAGVSLSEIHDYLAPINGGTDLLPLFKSHLEIPWNF